MGNGWYLTDGASNRSLQEGDAAADDVALPQWLVNRMTTETVGGVLPVSEPLGPGRGYICKRHSSKTRGGCRHRSDTSHCPCRRASDVVSKRLKFALALATRRFPHCVWLVSYGHLHAHHVKAFEHATARRHQKRCNPPAFRVDVAESNTGSSTGIGDVADAALGHVVDDGPGIVGGGKIRVVQVISPATQINCVTG